MTAWQQEAFGPIGARVRKIEAIAVTAASTVIDLSLRTNIYADLIAGRLCLADADGADVYYAFSSEAAADTIDNLNTTAGNATQCARIPSGALVEFRPPYFALAEKNAPTSGITNDGMARYLVVKTATGLTATLRLSIVSEPIEKRTRG